MQPIIHHGDARTILPTLQKGLIVTDPPYNVGYEYDGYKDRMSKDDYLEFIIEVCPLPCVIIHYPESIVSISMALKQEPTKMVAWVYPANTPRQWRAIAWFGITPDFTLDSQEYRNQEDRRIQQLIMEGKRARLYDWWEINQVKNVSDEKSDHPCQIPLAVMRRILKITPAQLVIDPFCGSGTTLVAAQELGIQSIGIEQSAEYIEIAKQRCSPILQFNC